MPVASPLRPLLDLLHQMSAMIDGIDDAGYASPAPGRSSGGIGGHVRHCLDHVAALVAGTRSGVCAYDRRARGTEVETCRCAARRVIAELSAEILRLDPSSLDGAVEVETQLDPAGTMIVTRSSVSREVVFVVSHTIHHNAIVGQMLRARGVDIGPRFGLAPATPAEALACAR